MPFIVLGLRSRFNIWLQTLKSNTKRTKATNKTDKSKHIDNKYDEKPCTNAHFQDERYFTLIDIKNNSVILIHQKFKNPFKKNNFQDSDTYFQSFELLNKYC